MSLLTRLRGGPNKSLQVIFDPLPIFAPAKTVIASNAPELRRYTFFTAKLRGMMSTLESLVAEAKSRAKKHAEQSAEIISSQGLAAALDYCREQELEPPQCSLTAASQNAEALRGKAKRALSDAKWWERRLEKKAVQDFEMRKRQSGDVNGPISDEAFQYYKDKKGRE